jgi:hypothetical protein
MPCSAYSHAEIIEDGAWLLRHVTELSAQQESPYEMQWKTSDAPAKFIAALIRGIVGVRITISRVDAKAKMGQNRDTRDALGAADGLAARSEGADLAVSAMMRSVRTSMSWNPPSRLPRQFLLALSPDRVSRDHLRLASGPIAGLAVTGGLVLADFFFMAVAMVGLTAIATALGPLFQIVKYAGAA